MWFLAILSFSFSAFAYEYGSLSRPAPVSGDEFSKSAVTYEAVDWRNKNGINWLGPVRNQSNCGSCVAFGAISTLEDQLTIDSGLAWRKEAFSQEALFSAGRAKCSSGWFPLDAARTIEKFGVLDVACAPYLAGATGKVPLYRTFCESQTERTLRVKSWKAYVGAANVKEALKRGPLLTSMLARKGFDSYSGGIFKSTMFTAVLGGHAVELVGYNDIERYWIIKNSWGDTWGENGYARVSYDDAQGISAETYGFDFHEDEGGFESPRDDEFVEGKVAIKGQLTDVELLKKGVAVSRLNCLEECELETAPLSNGEYVLRSVSKMGRVLTRRFTVANNVPAITWKLSAPAGFDFSYPQEKRIFFDLKFEGEFMPEFILMEIKKGAQTVFQRSFPDVMPLTRIGFNSESLPNGSYEVFFKHKIRSTDSKAQSLNVILKN